PFRLPLIRAGQQFPDLLRRQGPARHLLGQFRRIDELRVGRILLYEPHCYEIRKESSHHGQFERNGCGLLAFGLQPIAPLPQMPWLDQRGREISDRGEEFSHYPVASPARLLGGRSFGKLRRLERIKSPEGLGNRWG